MSKSKGKWIPGGKPVSKECHRLFHCEPCDRSFTKYSYYEKHITTELHFKRISRQVCRNYSSDPDYFEQVRSKRSCRIAGERLKKNGKTLPSQSKIETHIYCPTCFSSVEKRRMGNHLISHFHFQKTSSNDRNINTEKNLILDNIHEIVIQSPFQCAPCKFYFTQPDQLLNHFATNHLKLNVKSWSRRTTGWSCSACRNVLAPSGQAMMEHLSSQRHLKMQATIGKSIPIILKEVFLQACPLCAKKFLLNRELLSHTKAKHESSSIELEKETHNEAKQCTLVGILRSSKTFATKSTAVSSVKTESSSIGDSIPELVLNTSTKPKLRKSNSTTPEDDETYRCESCPLVFQSLTSLHRHSGNAHRDRHSNGFKCQFCEYTTKKRSHFLRHIGTHDDNRQKKFTCHECGAAFHQMYSLTYHKKLHTGKSIKCQYPGCNFLARSKSEVTSHEVKHTKGSFTCDKCNYTAKTKRHLKRHNLLQHEPLHKSMMYQCQRCFFTTKLANSLKRHELQHTGEKPFKCPHCSYATRNIENLRCHVLIRQYHPGKSLYYCRICLKAGIEMAEVFKTNKFCDFQTHVSKNHLDCPYRRFGLFAIAGIQIPEELPFDLPQLPQDEVESEMDLLHFDQINTRANGECTHNQLQYVLGTSQARPENNFEHIANIEVEGSEISLIDKDNSFILPGLLSTDQLDEVLAGDPVIIQSDTLDFTNINLVTVSQEDL